MMDSRPSSSKKSSSEVNGNLDVSYAENEQHSVSREKRMPHGNEYQLKLLILFAVKGNNSQVAFRLASKMAEAKSFNGLVFRYVDSNSNIKYRFLHAKHRQHLRQVNKITVTNLTAPTGDFSLQKYFESFLSISNSNQFRDGEIHDFIICTNTDFDFMSEMHKGATAKSRFMRKWKDYLRKKTDDDIILSLGGKRYVFTDNPALRTQLVSELKNKFNFPQQNDFETNLNRFLDKLVFAVSQPTGKILEKIIKDSIGNVFNLINDVVYNEVYTYMYGWMISRNTGDTAYFLENKDLTLLLEDTMKNIASLTLYGSTLLSINKIKSMKIAFKDTSLTTINLLNKNILVVFSENVVLSEIKVYQIFSKKYSEGKLIISDEKSLAMLRGSDSDPILAFRAAEKSCVIITKPSRTDRTGLLRGLYAIAKASEKKKMVLVAHVDQREYFKDIFKDEHSEVIDDDNSLDDLTIESRNMILDNEITLFGKQLVIGNLQSNDDSSSDLSSPFIDGNALTEIITSGRIISIGNIHQYEFDDYVDIQRTLNLSVKISDECFKKNTDDIFAICGMEKPQFNILTNGNGAEFSDNNNCDPKPAHIRFIRLADENRDIYQDFGQLCLDYKEYSIHLLECVDQELEWKKTHGSLVGLRKFAKLSHTKSIADLADLAIVVGQAGMGKSTLLTTISLATNCTWPIRISLNNYETEIGNGNFDDLCGIVKFLSNLIDHENANNSLIVNLLTYSIKQQGQVLLMFDGYDEIKELCKKKIIQLVSTLRSAPCKVRVIITTRSYAQAELEDALTTFAYSLNPFNEQEQKKFLETFWFEKHNVTESDQRNKIGRFATKLLSHLHTLNLVMEEGLVGIALQARMVAEIFEDECQTYEDSSDFGITNIFDVYKRFIEHTYDRYFKEKLHINGILNEAEQITLTTKYSKEHGYWAMKSLFSGILNSDEYREGLLVKQTFSVKDLEKIGFLKAIKNDGTIEFIHLTYAKYFVSELLGNALRNVEDHPNIGAANKFLRTQIFRDKNRVIRTFISHKVEKENLIDKWRVILDCDLFHNVQTSGTLQLQNNVIVNPSDFASENSLSDTLRIVDKNMNWVDDKYYYNNDFDCVQIQRLFDVFFSVTNIIELETTLKFLLKANENSYYTKANIMFQKNITKAASHYLMNNKNESILKKELKNDCLKIMFGAKGFTDLKELIMNISANDDTHLRNLAMFFIPSKIESSMKLAELNNALYFMEKDHPTAYHKIKSYIISLDEINQKKLAESIIESLRNADCENNGFINRLLIGGNAWDLRYLRSFYTDIVCHPCMISHTKSYLNSIYSSYANNLRWIERNGILISRVLELLTPEMAKSFVPHRDFDGLPFGVAKYYINGLFLDLINYLIKRMKTDELSYIDKSAFLMILTPVLRYSLSKKSLILTSELLETILKLIVDFLNGDTFKLHEIIDCFFELARTGLKFIDVKTYLLVLDPASEFECTISISCMDHLVELMRWRNNNIAEPRDNFIRKCDEVVQYSTNPVTGT